MRRWLLFGVIGLGFVAALASAHDARAAGEVRTRVDIRPIGPLVIGEPAELLVDLRVARGGTLADQPIELSINGEYLRRTRTNADGVANFHMPRDLSPGEYLLTALFPGDTDAYFPSTGEFLLVIEPAELVIETVPPLPGVAFTLDGRRFVADGDGLARISVDRPGDHELVVLTDENRNRGHAIEFSRWGTELFGPRITINLPRMEHLQAGFDVFVPARQVFLDPEGGTVDPARVTSITMRSSLGKVVSYPDGRERLYQASRSVRRPQGLESVEIRYSVESVEVDGSNVVNSGQQHFYAGREDTWEISLLLYSMRVIPHDALFGFTAGSEIEVTFPNGATELISAGEDGQIVVPWLARGIYRVKAADAPGWAPAMPVALSRDQEVELRVISYLDMVLAISLGLAIALGLLHRGRPHIIRGTVQAAGRGFGRASLPVLGGGAGGAEHARNPAAAPAVVVGDPPPEPASQAARKAPARVDAQPLLATIAGRSALDDRVAITVGGRPVVPPAPASRELLDLAPFLAEPAPTVTESSNGDVPPESGSGPPNGAPAPAAARRRRSGSTTAADAATPGTRTKGTAKQAKQKPAKQKPAQANATAAKAKPAKPKARKTSVSAAKRDSPSSKSATTREQSSGKPKGRRTAAGASVSGGATRTVGGRASTSARPARGGSTKGRSKTSAKAERPAGASSSKRASRGAAPAAQPGTGRAARPPAQGQPASAGLPRPALPSEHMSMLGIPDVPQTPSTAPELPPSEMLTVCRHCGLELWAKALYCRRCGEPTARPDTLEPMPVVVAAESATERHRASDGEPIGRRRSIGARRKATKRGGS